MQKVQQTWSITVVQNGLVSLQNKTQKCASKSSSMKCEWSNELSSFYDNGLRRIERFTEFTEIESLNGSKWHNRSFIFPSPLMSKSEWNNSFFVCSDWRQKSHFILFVCLLVCYISKEKLSKCKNCFDITASVSVSPSICAFVCGKFSVTFSISYLIWPFVECCPLRWVP